MNILHTSTTDHNYRHVEQYVARRHNAMSMLCSMYLPNINKPTTQNRQRYYKSNRIQITSMVYDCGFEVRIGYILLYCYIINEYTIVKHPICIVLNKLRQKIIYIRYYM